MALILDGFLAQCRGCGEIFTIYARKNGRGVEVEPQSRIATKHRHTDWFPLKDVQGHHCGGLKQKCGRLDIF